MTRSNAKDKTGDSPLYKAINSLRSDIQRLVEEHEGDKIRFEIPEVKLELELVAQKTGSAEVGFEWKWLPITAKAGGELARSSTHTHRLSLTLRPIVMDEKGESKDVYLSSKKKRKLPKQGDEGK